MDNRITAILLEYQLIVIWVHKKQNPAIDMDDILDQLTTLEYLYRLHYND